MFKQHFGYSILLCSVYLTVFMINKSEGQTACGTLADSACTTAFDAAYLARTNLYRNLHGASNLSVITAIQTKARSTACSLANDALTTAPAVESGETILGQLLYTDNRATTSYAVGSGDASACTGYANLAVDTWYNTSANYNFLTGAQSGSALTSSDRFAQLVWKSTTEFACGLGTKAAVTGGSATNAWLVVTCFYNSKAITTDAGRLSGVNALTTAATTTKKNQAVSIGKGSLNHLYSLVIIYSFSSLFSF